MYVSDQNSQDKKIISIQKVYSAKCPTESMENSAADLKSENQKNYLIFITKIGNINAHQCGIERTRS